MSSPRVGWVECLLVGIFVFGVLGTGGVLLGIVGMVLLIRGEWMSVTDFDPTILACAAASAAIVGIFAWRLIVRTPDARPLRGAVAGLLVGFLAHPLCWMIATSIPMIRDPALRPASLGDIAFSVVFMTLLTSISSLGLAGWISIPLGGLLGYCTRRISQLRTRPLPAAPGDAVLEA